MLSYCAAACLDVLGFGLPCTQMGLAELVTVDLTNVLPIEGGDYQATLTLPDSDESTTGILSGNSEIPLEIAFSTDLEDEPVEVRVEVLAAGGDSVYSGAGQATPAMSQPNGPSRDPDNYWLSLQANDACQLVPLARFEPVRDEQGRVSMSIYTLCGILWLDDPAGADGPWVRVDGRLDDGVGGPPPGWSVPVQRGWAAVAGDALTFEDERGHREVFRRATNADQWLTCVQ